MASSSKRQTTFAKIQREQRVREKRVLKAEKKAAAREAKLAGLADPTAVVEIGEDGEVIKNTEPAEDETPRAVEA